MKIRYGLAWFVVCICTPPFDHPDWGRLADTIKHAAAWLIG